MEWEGEKKNGECKKERESEENKKKIRESKVAVIHGAAKTCPAFS